MPEPYFTISPNVPVYWTKFNGLQSPDAVFHICQVGLLLNCQRFTKVPDSFKSHGCYLVDVKELPACENCPLGLT